MRVLSVRQHPDLARRAIAYFQTQWATPASMDVYEDAILHSLTTSSLLPQWYLLMEEDTIQGCAGLIPNDFISRMDLFPWLCALYVEPAARGKRRSGMLIAAAEQDALTAGYRQVYLCTDHIGFYEKFGYEYIGTGHHPWGESSRIYQKTLAGIRS